MPCSTTFEEVGSCEGGVGGGGGVEGREELGAVVLTFFFCADVRRKRPT